MIDPNSRIDYGKMKKLLQFDKLDGERKGIIRKIAEMRYKAGESRQLEYLSADRKCNENRLERRLKKDAR